MSPASFSICFFFFYLDQAATLPTLFEVHANTNCNTNHNWPPVCLWTKTLSDGKSSASERVRSRKMKREGGRGLFLHRDFTSFAWGRTPLSVTGALLPSIHVKVAFGQWESTAGFFFFSFFTYCSVYSLIPLSKTALRILLTCFVLLFVVVQCPFTIIDTFKSLLFSLYLTLQPVTVTTFFFLNQYYKSSLTMERAKPFLIASNVCCKYCAVCYWLVVETLPNQIVPHPSKLTSMSCWQR